MSLEQDIAKLRHDLASADEASYRSVADMIGIIVVREGRYMYNLGPDGGRPMRELIAWLGAIRPWVATGPVRDDAARAVRSTVLSLIDSMHDQLVREQDSEIYMGML